jgi:hypothetical protein
LQSHMLDASLSTYSSDSWYGCFPCIILFFHDSVFSTSEWIVLRGVVIIINNI